jgi:hypothetical protein
VPNYDLKIPCVLSSNRTVEPNDYDYIKQKRNERNVLYDKNDLTYLDKWIKDDKHPSIKYYVADIRYSELSKTKCGYCIPSRSPFNATAAILFAENFNEKEFDDAYECVFVIDFISKCCKQLSKEPATNDRNYVYAKCTCKDFYFNGI